MNDLELVSDGAYLAGHSYGSTGSVSVIKGSVVKVDSSGSYKWSKNYGNYPGGINQHAKIAAAPEGLVYTECWGIAQNS